MPVGKPFVVDAGIDAILREITKALTLALEGKVEAQLGTRPWPEQQSAKIFAAMGVLAQVLYRTTRRDSIEETLRAVSVTLADLLEALVVASSRGSGKAWGRGDGAHGRGVVARLVQSIHAPMFAPARGGESSGQGKGPA